MATTRTAAAWSAHGTTDGTTTPDDITLDKAYRYLTLYNRDKNGVVLTFQIVTVDNPADFTALGDGTIVLSPGMYYVWKTTSLSTSNKSRFRVKSSAAGDWSAYGSNTDPDE